MPDPTLDDLRAVLQDRAHATPAPAFPEDLLGDRVTAQRRRSRRRFAAVAAAAAVAAVIAAVAVPNLGSKSSDQNQPPATGPTSTATGSPDAVHLERGPAPTVAYTVGNQLRYPDADGEVSVDLGGQPSGLRQAGDLVMVTVDDTRLRVFHLGSRHDVVDEPTSGPGLLSADGHYAAWVKPGSGKPVVAVRRLDGNEPADRLMTFPEPQSCCDNPFNLIGITSDGRLVAWMGALMKTWVWDFAHQASSVTEVHGVTDPNPSPGTDGGPGTPTQIAGDQLVVAYDGGGYGRGPISTDGLWTARQLDQRALESASNVHMSPDGVSLAVVAPSDAFDASQTPGRPLVLWLQVSEGGYRLGIPADSVNALAFEDDQTLLISTLPDADGTASIVRCRPPAADDNTDGVSVVPRCELAASVRGAGVLLPD